MITNVITYMRNTSPASGTAISGSAGVVVRVVTLRPAPLVDDIHDEFLSAADRLPRPGQGADPIRLAGRVGRHLDFASGHGLEPRDLFPAASDNCDN